MLSAWQMARGGSVIAAAALSVAVCAVPAPADVPSMQSPAAASTIVRTTPCESGGTITTTIRRTSGRVSVHFELSGALPLERYGFGVEWVAKPPRKVGQPGSYDGATTTDLVGSADFAGFAAPVKSRVSYRFVAQSSTNQCFARGVIRPR
ncbi:hypothetical protein NSZ01_00210 [Nocardioides szechwanensis]|nr:hypothetical protein NSZ01_00210 [Nocardioides szechwanensis]